MGMSLGLSFGSLSTIFLGYLMDRSKITRSRVFMVLFLFVCFLSTIICFLVLQFIKFENSLSTASQISRGLIFILIATSGYFLRNFTANLDSHNFKFDERLKKQIWIFLIFRELGILSTVLLTNLVILKILVVKQYHYYSLIISIAAFNGIISLCYLFTLKNEPKSENNIADPNKKVTFKRFCSNKLNRKLALYTLQVGNYGVHLLFHLNFIYTKMNNLEDDKKLFFGMLVQIFRSISALTFLPFSRKLHSLIPIQYQMLSLNLFLVFKLLITGWIDIKSNEKYIFILIVVELLHGFLSGTFYVFSRINAEIYLKNTCKNGTYDKNVSEDQINANTKYISIVNTIITAFGYGLLPGTVMSAYTGIGKIIKTLDVNTDSGIKWILTLASIDTLLFYSIFSSIDYFLDKKYGDFGGQSGRG